LNALANGEAKTGPPPRHAEEVVLDQKLLAEGRGDLTRRLRATSILLKT
jgi:hypothetical protein